MACYRNRKVTVKFTEQEYADFSRFLTYYETRTMSRLIRRALYDYRKAQTRTTTAQQEAADAQADVANAKKLTDSMSENKPAKRGRRSASEGGYVRRKPAEDKSDKSTATKSRGFKPGIRGR